MFYFNNLIISNMKSIIQKFGLAMVAAAIVFAGCDKKDESESENGQGAHILFGPDKTQIGDGKKEFFVTEDATLKKGTYTMVGWIYVEDGVTLTIEPGTVIRGSNTGYDGVEAATGSSLIIRQGGKIIAEGTREQPIVFTSAKPKGERRPADWGGIIICGKAPNNGGAQMTIEGGVNATHGGSDPDDNSGILKYVRIEFCGYPFQPNSEINGLTLGSVGAGTTVDYIQVSYCGDDSFEWFGGTVNSRYLIAYHGWDDDFDTDAGFSGKIQFALAVRDPKIADTSVSNAFESDNSNSNNDATPYTAASFSNVTVVGPRIDPGFENTVAYIDCYGWGGGIQPGLFQSAIQIRRGSRLSCHNSAFAGFPVGLILESQSSRDFNPALKNIFFAGMGVTGADANSAAGNWSGDFSANYFTAAERNNRVLPNISDLMLRQPDSKQAGVNWGPAADSPLRAAGAADFTGLDTWFTRVSYAGAFASDAEADDWTKGWANFDPQNTEY
jgi:hypothetical protein